MKKDFEFFLGNKDWAFSLMLLFVLLSMEVDAVTQEKCCKKNTVGALGSDGGKVIFTLLAKVIAFHVGLTTINVR